jgi:hypothetical protein
MWGGGKAQCRHLSCYGPARAAHGTPTGWIHPQGIAEVGALRAGYSAGGYGFLLLLDTDRWAHPWVATTGRGSGHWTLGHGNVKFVQGWREVIRAWASGETTPGQHTQLPHAMGSTPGTPGPSVLAQGPVRLRAPGHQVWPGDRHSYMQLICLVATPVKDTGLGGGLTPSVLA